MVVVPKIAAEAEPDSKPKRKPYHKWANVVGTKPKQYVCGHCYLNVGADKGYSAEAPKVADQRPLPRIFICPNCTLPTLFYDGHQIPGTAPGNDVAHLPADIDALYQEARKSVAGGAPTAAVLACRKLLMSIAVAQRAKEGLSFQAYVEHLAGMGYLPPNGKGWVDHIRKKGNEANHEIKLMKPEDAMELIAFAEMLLKFIYEFPKRVPAADVPAA
jgi:hypothetical protein